MFDHFRFLIQFFVQDRPRHCPEAVSRDFRPGIVAHAPKSGIYRSVRIDPDTKESLGREEVKVGKVKVTQVNPKTSQAEILEDTGIDAGAILRKPQ